jgi:hypothetical protein
MDLDSATPHNELASTGYCLANPEREFLVYLPEGDQASVDLSHARGKFSVEWMHPAEGSTMFGGNITGGKEQSLAVPFTGPAVLYIKKESA